MPLDNAKVGDSVTVEVWGKEVTGKVERVSNSIVWVRMDATGRLQWFHRSSTNTIKEIR